MHFFLQPQVTVYISGGVTIYLLHINTESTEFQPNSTGFKLVSSADIRFEQIKTTKCDQRIYPCDILEVGGKDCRVCSSLYKEYTVNHQVYWNFLSGKEQNRSIFQLFKC